MDNIADTLLATALTVGVIHTLIGVDHAIPFIVLSRAQKWSLYKTWWITGLCGLGHVLSSVVIGAVGIGLGVAVSKLEWIESQRGSLAAWTLIGFGLAYTVWGLYRGWRSRSPAHLHADGTVHSHPSGPSHEHPHEDGHTHHHHGPRVVGGFVEATPTVGALFVVFVLGPCEALIPLLMVPASQNDPGLVAAVVAVFGVATIATMLTVVTLGYYGIRARVFDVLERHAHTAAGLAIALSGIGIQLLGI